MGQRAAKHNMQAGVRLYHQRHHAQAIHKWRQALHRLTNAEDRFITLGYLAQAFCDSGEFEAMLHYALQQMELANERHDEYMKSEAFLNLAKAYERLADFSKALSYGKASLQHPSMDPRTPGYAHLGEFFFHVHSVGFFVNEMNTTVRGFQRSHARPTSCLSYKSANQFRDLSKALIFLRNAMAIVQSVTVDDVHAKYRCTILYHLSVALRMRGSLVEAKEACDEALQLASETGNRALHARCMCSLADIFRELGESEAKETLTKSWARYEEAYRVLRASQDRMGEVLVLASMAKSASESRSHYTGQCECQAIQLNKKCLDIARTLGCKHVMLKCHSRLAELYSQLNDEDGEEVARRAASQLTQEMELFCNFCGQRYGIRDESLQALRCSHVFHERCLHTLLLEREDQTCPKCRCRAIVSDNISMRTPSICSTAEAQTPSSTFSVLPTPFLRAAPSYNDLFIQAERDISQVDRALDRTENRNDTSTRSKAKPPPPPRKPCCSKDGLPPSFVVSLPPPMPLSESGPLVVSRAPTITDV
uniref:RING-type domain-containing protein n=1 Tax=Angiostrongylus cantonensis TaxID=6313 RepID=A0A158P852_ANGCA